MFMNNPVFSNKSTKEKKIFIVNISKDPRGSFNIISQTIEILKQNQENYTCYVFCRMDELLKYKSPSIKIILINLNIFQRFFFESSFLINWSKKNNIYADLIISCQNTSINYFKHRVIFQDSNGSDSNRVFFLLEPHLPFIGTFLNNDSC